MSRIIGGAARGRRLVVPPGLATRPTSSRTREALFSSLGSLLGEWSGRSFLDLYAGSGAVGLEAASRGAGPVVLVESERSAWHACRENLVTLDLPGVTLKRADARQFLQARPARPFDVVFLDPPYAEPNATVSDVLRLLVGHGWCAEQGFVVAERSARGRRVDWPPGLRPLHDRRYGDATLWYGRALPAGRLPESDVPPADPRRQPPA